MIYAKISQVHLYFFYQNTQPTDLKRLTINTFLNAVPSLQDKKNYKPGITEKCPLKQAKGLLKLN